MADIKPTPNKPPMQTDIELEPVDQAARAVREYQAGKTTTAYVRARLSAIAVEDLELVAIATRVPVGTLRKLRGAG